MSASDATIERLRRERRRPWFFRVTALAVLALVVLAWTTGGLDAGDLLSARRAANVERFVTTELVPGSVRGAPDGAKLSAFADWLGPRLTGRNLDAALATLQLAVVAAALAALLGLLLAPFAARPRGGAKRYTSRAVRALCLLMRAIPEYVLAFLLGALFPSAAWACVIALVIHNGGVLGRLFGETLENVEPRPAEVLRGLGARRSARLLVAELPMAAPRLAAYAFYRFETCARESTVLGMLGFVSLGHWIVQERAAGRYDEVLVLVALGAAIVVLSDLTSWWVRGRLRRAGGAPTERS